MKIRTRQYHVGVVLSEVTNIEVAEMNVVVGGLAVIALTGCASSSFEATAKEANAAPLVIPKEYRKLIATEVKAVALDPDSIKSGQISPPAERFMGAATRIAVCVRFNGKNAFGGYSGVQTYIAVFVGERLSSVSPDDTKICRTETSYAPFPEINGK